MSTMSLALDVAAARQGNRAAWSRLITAYRPVLRAIALVRVDAATADDVVQETLTMAFTRLDQLRDDEAFPGWLCAIARQQAATSRRRARPWWPLEQVTAWISPAPTAEAREALDAIRALPEPYRELMIMRLVEGLTGPEIGLRLGRTPESVRVSLHRGMAMLRDALGER